MSLDYNPIWDRTRAELPGRTYKDADTSLGSDFECGNGYGFRKVAGDHYTVEVEPDPGEHIFSGKGYYFCFAVRNNRGVPRRLTLEVCSPHQEDYAWRTQHVIVKRGTGWSHLPAEDVLTPPDEHTISFHLDLPARTDADPVLFVSNYHWYPYTEMTAYLRQVAADHAHVRVASIGRSVKGRDLWAAEVGATVPDAPTIVCAQTPQPSEMGHFACRAILDYLLSAAPRARDVLARYRVCLIPHTNPDGTVLGYGVSDALGHFPYFEGDRAIAGASDATPAQVAVWAYLERTRPWLFIEWHSNHWAYRPGHMLLRYDPELVDDPVTHRVWESFEERLAAIPYTFGDGTKTNLTQGYSTSIGVGVATRWGGIPIMIKQHDKFALEVSRRHAVACLLAAVDAREEHGG